MSISTCLVGGFNPSEKYESQLGCLLPIYGKIRNDPNHQAIVHCSFTIRHIPTPPHSISPRDHGKKSQVLLRCAMVKDHAFGGWLWSSYHGFGLLTMDRLVD